MLHKEFVSYLISTLCVCLLICLPLCMPHAWQQTFQMSRISACFYACMTTNLSNVHIPPYRHAYPFCLSICTHDKKPAKCSHTTLSTCLSFLPVFMHAWQQTCQMFTYHPVCMSILSACLYACMTKNLPNVHIHPTCMSILSACLYACMTTNLSNVHIPPYLHVYARLTTNQSNVHCPPYLYVYPLCLSICMPDNKPVKCSLSTLYGFLNPQ